SRRPLGSPAAAITAAANPPYTTSLSSSAPGGDKRAASRRATVVLPEPGGPATTHTGARTRPGYGARVDRSATVQTAAAARQPASWAAPPPVWTPRVSRPHSHK